MLLAICFHFTLLSIIFPSYTRSATFFRHTKQLRFWGTQSYHHDDHHDVLFIRGGENKQIHSIDNHDRNSSSSIVQRNSIMNRMEQKTHYLTLALIDLESFMNVEDWFVSHDTFISSMQDNSRSISNLIWSFIQTHRIIQSTNTFSANTHNSSSSRQIFPACLMAIPLPSSSQDEEDSTTDIYYIQNATLSHILETMGCLSDIIILVLPSTMDASYMKTNADSSSFSTTTHSSIQYVFNHSWMDSYIHYILKGIKRQLTDNNNNVTLFLVSHTTTDSSKIEGDSSDSISIQPVRLLDHKQQQQEEKENEKYSEDEEKKLDSWKRLFQRYNMNTNGVHVYTIQIPSSSSSFSSTLLLEKQNLTTNTTTPWILERILLPYYSSGYINQKNRIPLSLFPTLVNQVYDYLSSSSSSHKNISGVKKKEESTSFTHADMSIITLSNVIPSICRTIPSSDDHSSHDSLSSSSSTSTSKMILQETNTIDKEEEEMGNTSNHHLHTITQPNIDWDHVFEEVALKLQDKMNALEMKQDEVLFDIDRRMPILEFGQDANQILLDANILIEQYILNKTWEDIDTKLMEDKTNQFLRRIAGDTGIRRLFRQQLESLREYYGRRYELLIHEIESASDSSTETPIRSSTNMEQQIIHVASKITESFRVAAQNAVPQLCKEGTSLHDIDGGYGYVDVLAGLIRDMTDISSSVQRMNEAWDNANEMEQEEDDDEDNTFGLEDEEPRKKGQWYSRVINIFKKKKRQRPAKWYEKLASRAITLAINYLQGWLAWQGLKKAAEERDRNVPKFPLF